MLLHFKSDKLMHQISAQKRFPTPINLREEKNNHVTI